MASRLFRSPADWALPLLVAAIETAAAAPLVALIDAFLDDKEVVADIFIPALGIVGLIAFFSTRLLARKALGLRVSRVIMLVAWLVVTLVWIGLLRFGGIGDADARPVIIFTGLLSLLAWWRGIGYGVDPAPFLPDRLSRLVRNAWILLAIGIFLAAVINGFDTKPALDAARTAVPVAAIGGLMLLALGQIEATRRAARARGGRAPARRGWLIFALGFALALMLIASLGSAVLGGESGNLLLTALGFVLNGVLFVFSYIALALAIVFYVLLYPLIWVLRRGADKQPDQNQQQGVTDTTLDQIVKSNGDALPDWVRITLIVVAVVIVAVVVTLLLFSALRRFRPMAETSDGDEERESVWSRDLARSQLRNLFRRSHGDGGPERIDLNATPPTVRDAYRALQALAVRDGVPRKPAETPAEFSRRLGAAWPGDAHDIADLTRRYERVRYGGESDEIDRGAAQGAWRAIWGRRSTMA